MGEFWQWDDWGIFEDILADNDVMGNKYTLWWTNIAMENHHFS